LASQKNETTVADIVSQNQGERSFGCVCCKRSIIYDAKY